MISNLEGAYAIEEMLDLENTWPLSGIMHEQLASSPQACTVVVVGAYKGKVLEYFLRLPDVHIETAVGYEPQVWASDMANDRLTHYPQATVQPYGLGTRLSNIAIMNEFGTDACSFVRPETRPDHVGYGTMHEAVLELNKLNTPIDLMVMNIEGYEYTLLKHIFVDYIESLASPIERLAVQFHEGLCSPRQYADILYALDKYYPHNFNYFLPSWGYWYT